MIGKADRYVVASPVSAQCRRSNRLHLSIRIVCYDKRKWKCLFD